ncbi:MAG: hypothetical protein AAF478_02430 [Pseudomonadota bacterium]
MIQLVRVAIIRTRNNMSETFLFPFVAIAFLIIFPLFWFGVVWMVSRIGGWAKLASIHPANAPVQGDVYRWRSARIRLFSSYRSSLTITVNNEGIHMQPLIFFRFGHEPIFIPWQAVSKLERTTLWPLASAKMEIRMASGEKPMTLKLYGDDLAECLERMQQ